MKIINTKSLTQSNLFQQTTDNYKKVWTFFESVPLVVKGEPELNTEGLLTLTGSVYSNPQTHWYLEPLCSVAEFVDGRLLLEVTTQYQSHIHEQVAFILGLKGREQYSFLSVPNRMHFPT